MPLLLIRRKTLSTTITTTEIKNMDSMSMKNNGVNMWQLMKIRTRWRTKAYKIKQKWSEGKQKNAQWCETVKQIIHCTDKHHCLTVNVITVTIMNAIIMAYNNSNVLTWGSSPWASSSFTLPVIIKSTKQLWASLMFAWRKAHRPRCAMVRLYKICTNKTVLDPLKP